MKNGKRYSKRVDFSLGNPRNPMTMEDIIKKFKDCASYSAKPLSQQNIERVIEMVGKLEEVDDVSQIISLLG